MFQTSENMDQGPSVLKVFLADGRGLGGPSQHLAGAKLAFWAVGEAIAIPKRRRREEES